MHDRPRGSDGFDNVMIAGAAADIAFQTIADLLFGEAFGVRFDQIDRAHHHAGGAKAALQAVMFAEHFLHRVQRAVGGGEAFDGGDVDPFGLDGEHGARFHRFAIDRDHAGAALTGVTADMGAGEVQVIAQQFDQQGAAFDMGVRRFAVHCEFNMGHWFLR